MRLIFAFLILTLSEWPVEIGKVDVRTCTFDKEWEAVPGE